MPFQSTFVQNQPSILAGAGASIGDTSIILTSLTQNDGTLLTMADFGTKGNATIEPNNNAYEEAITFSGVTQNANGTATLTGVKTRLTVSPYTETSGLAITHAGGTTLVISNEAGLYGDMIAYIDAAVVAGGVDATTTVKGIAKISVAPASATEPITVGDNDPRVPTADENNALVGNNTDIAVGTGNKFVTQTGLQHSAEVYAASASGNDTYAVTLSPVPTSYTAGMTIRFKPDAANTGACSLNVNGLGAIAIKKKMNVDLSDNDILAGQVVEVIYDGSGTPYFQMVGASLISQADVTDLTDGGDTTLHTHSNFGPIALTYSASNTLQQSADTERTNATNSYVKVKEISFTGNIETSAIRVKFDLKSVNASGGNLVAGRIYKNGSAVGTERINDTTNYITYSEDLGSIAKGDLIQLYIRGYSGSFVAYARNFQIYFTKTYSTPGTTVVTD